DRPPPVIITGPVNQTLPIKSIAFLKCKAVGAPKPVISWYKEGLPVISSPRVNLTTNGDLIISSLNIKEDPGLYTCVASSRSGKSTWSSYLSVEMPNNPNIKFNRAPDKSKYPTAPGQPKLVNTTHDSITISWENSEKLGSLPFLGYSVEMYSNNMTHKSWVPVAAELKENIVLFQNMNSVLVLACC
uniref:Ig-like domain-containing protein n=1 Tax=Megaselia scalaris TaxID=36166 RepID=T1GBY5_MEGSC